MSRSSVTYMRGVAMMGFSELLDSAGVVSAAVLRDAGLPPNAGRDADALLPFEGCCRAFEIAALRTGWEDFGLRMTLAMPPHLPNTGPIAMIGGFVSNGEEWIFAGLRYYRYHTNSFTFTLLPDDDPGRVVARHLGAAPGIPPRQILEHSLANVVMLSRYVFDRPDESPLVVRFQHLAPADVETHARVFRCPVEFGCEHTEIVFDRSYLKYPTGGKKQIFKPLLDLYVRQRIRHLPIYEQTLRMTVALAIPSVMGTGRCTADFIAASLGYSVKQLQRILAREGTTFSIILEGVKRRRACRLLVETDMPVARIAGLLDYSAPAPFILAFRRWTDMTPLDFRRQARLNPALLPPEDEDTGGAGVDRQTP